MKVKRLLFFVFVVVLFSCDLSSKKPAEAERETKSTQADGRFGLDWLEGDWKRLNDEPGKETYESWQKIDSTQYSGVGFTLQNSDTIWKEDLSLVKSGDLWDLKVKASQEEDETLFSGVELGIDHFTMENLQNEFPTHIKYWKSGDQLNAHVSNSDMEIIFEFEAIDD